MRLAGQAVAGTLRGAWRSSPPRPEQVPTWAIDALVAGGGAGLAWWRLSRHGRPVPPAVERAWLGQAVGQRRMAARVRALGALLGFPPLILKGCALAGRYPAEGLRPSGGDIDVLVPVDQLGAVAAALAGTPLACMVDLTHAHRLRAGHETVELAPLAARGLGRSDDLRFCATHFVKHGGIRPYWLCDVAVLLEADEAGPDWEVVLDGPPAARDAVGGVLRLARDLLGAVLPAGAPAELARPAPGWAVDSVLRTWGRPYRRPAAAPRWLSVAGLRARVQRGRQPAIRAVDRLGLDWEDPDAAALRRDLVRRAARSLGRSALRRPA